MTDRARSASRQCDASEPLPSDGALKLRALAQAHPEIPQAFKAVLRERFPEYRGVLIKAENRREVS